jgi:NADPH:quinone reductase-like Zn-dependent oxidoreductase
MKASVYTRYGPPDVLEMMEVDEPTPEDGEVLVHIGAASVNFADTSFVRGKPFMVRLMAQGIFKPKHTILGSDIAGRVEQVGHDVMALQPGDQVFGDISECGWGGFAEYVSVPEDALALKPANLTFEQAAAVPQAATVALQGLRDVGKIQPGEQVLINGASGGIGTFAIQIAKSFGAEVTGVCSTRNLELVRSLGADRVIDYTQEDFTRNGRLYDLILGTAGYRSIFDYRRALKPTGRYVMTGGAMRQVFEAMLLGQWLSKTDGKRLTNLESTPSRDDLVFLKGLIEAGKVTPVIDRCYSLGEVPEALRHYEGGHAKGKVVIRMEQDHKGLPATNGPAPGSPGNAGEKSGEGR